MLKQLINFYKVSSPRPCNGEALSSSDARRLKFLKWSTFLSATFGYGMYYVCRLSLNVVKKPIVDEGIFSVNRVRHHRFRIVFHLCHRKIHERFPCRP